MGLAGLVQKQRKRLFASIGVFIGVPVLALCCGTIVILSAPLNTPAANFDGPVAGPKPPKEVPRPPASSLHFGGQSVASAPTHWCKVIQSTMFCRGEEYIPLPPENKVLEAPAGAKLTFEFRGNERLRGCEAVQGRVSHPFTRGLNASAGTPKRGLVRREFGSSSQTLPRIVLSKTSRLGARRRPRTGRTGSSSIRFFRPESTSSASSEVRLTWRLGTTSACGSSLQRAKMERRS